MNDSTIHRAHKNQNRSSRYIKQYGFGFRHYRKLFIKQHGACAICGQKATQSLRNTESKLELCVDHCHTTGKVRGLLCNACNTGLGMFKDNPQALAKAIEYLARTSAVDFSIGIEVPKNLQRKRVSTPPP